MMRHLLAATAAVGLALSATAASAGPGVVIAPVSGTIDTSGPGFGTLADTWNQASLSSTYVSGVTNFDTYFAGAPTHTTNFGGFEYFGESGTSTLQVTYDLGSAQRLTALALWNEESAGIGSLNLLTSLDGISFTSLASGLVPTDNTLASTTYGADIFTFGSTAARYVRFEASSCPQPNPGSFPSCAIGEVAFRSLGGTVPEPSSWVMLIAGFGLVGAAQRRRVAATA